MFWPTDICDYHLSHYTTSPSPKVLLVNPFFLNLLFCNEWYSPSASNPPLMFFPPLSCVLFSTVITSGTSFLSLLPMVDVGGFHLFLHSVHVSPLSLHVIQLGLMPVIVIDSERSIWSRPGNESYFRTLVEMGKRHCLSLLGLLNW